MAAWSLKGQLQWCERSGGTRSHQHDKALRVHSQRIHGTFTSLLL